MTLSPSRLPPTSRNRPMPPQLCVTVTPGSAIGSENGIEFLGPARRQGVVSPFVVTPATIRSQSATSDMIDGIDLLPKDLADMFTARICSSDAHYYWRVGEYGEAFQALEEALELTPHDPELRVYYARCCIEVGEYGQARDHLLKSNSTTWEPHYLYGIMFLREHALKDAEKCLEEALRLFDDVKYEYHKSEKSAIYEAFGDLCMEKQKYQKAHEHYRSARSLDRNNEEYKKKIQKAQTMCVQDPNLYVNRRKPVISRRTEKRGRNEMSQLQRVIKRGSTTRFDQKKRGNHRSSRTQEDEENSFAGVSSTSTSSGSRSQTPPRTREEYLEEYRHYQHRRPVTTRASSARNPEHHNRHHKRNIVKPPKQRPMSTRESHRQQYHRQAKRSFDMRDDFDRSRNAVQQIELRAQRHSTDFYAPTTSIHDDESCTSSSDESEESVPTPIRVIAQHSNKRLRRLSDSSPRHNLDRPKMEPMTKSDTPLFESKHRFHDDSVCTIDGIVNLTRPVETRNIVGFQRDYDQHTITTTSDSSFNSRDDYDCEPRQTINTRGIGSFHDASPTTSQSFNHHSVVHHQGFMPVVRNGYPRQGIPDSRHEPIIVTPRNIRRERTDSNRMPLNRSQPFRDSQSSHSSSRGEHPVWRDRLHRDSYLFPVTTLTPPNPTNHVYPDIDRRSNSSPQPQGFLPTSRSCSPANYPTNCHPPPRDYQCEQQHLQTYPPQMYPPADPYTQASSFEPNDFDEKYDTREHTKNALRNLSNRDTQSYAETSSEYSHDTHHSHTSRISRSSKVSHSTHHSHKTHHSQTSHGTERTERKVQVRMGRKLKLRVQKQKEKRDTSKQMVPPPIPTGLISQSRNASLINSRGLPPPNTDLRQTPPHRDSFYSQNATRFAGQYTTGVVQMMDALYSNPIVDIPQSIPGIPQTQTYSPDERPARRYPGQPYQDRIPTNVVYNIG